MANKNTRHNAKPGTISKEIYLVTLVSIIGIIIISVMVGKGNHLTANAISWSSTSPEEFNNDWANRPIGKCVLRSDGSQIELRYNQNDQYERCRDIYLALRYNTDKGDFYRLLKRLGYNVYESDIIGKNLAVEFRMSEGQRLTIDESRQQVFPFNDVESKLASTECEFIDFFGMKLYCFNAGVNSLPKIIPALTYLKLAGDENVHNSIIEYLLKRYNAYNFRNDGLNDVNIEPFDFIVKEKIILVDGSKQRYLNNKLTYILHCGSYTGTEKNCFKITSHDLSLDMQASYYMPVETKRGEPFSTPLKEDLFRYVAVIYPDNPDTKTVKDYGLEIFHTAMHKFYGGHVHLIDRSTCPSRYDANIDFTIAALGDKNLASPYGVQAETALQFSQNNLLTCSDRKTLFERGISIIEHHLCTSNLCPDYSKDEEGISDCMENMYGYEEPDC